MKCNTKEAFKLFVKDILPYLLIVLIIVGDVFLLSYIPIIDKFLSTQQGEYIVLIVFGFLGFCSVFLFMALFVLLKKSYFELKNYINDLCKRSLLVSK